MYAQVDAANFREACARFATGVTVVTTLSRTGEPHGLTVTAFTPVSIAPPLVLACIASNCTFLNHFRESPCFAVNVLSERQQHLSVVFSEKPEGRFEGVDWYRNRTGAPLLRGALAVFECEVRQIADEGDHAILLGLVVYAKSHEGQPLAYFNRAYRRLDGA